MNRQACRCTACKRLDRAEFYAIMDNSLTTADAEAWADGIHADTNITDESISKFFADYPTRGAMQ